MLSGVALVVDDVRKGPKLVFRYPGVGGFWDRFVHRTPVSAGGVHTAAGTSQPAAPVAAQTAQAITTDVVTPSPLVPIAADSPRPDASPAAPAAGSAQSVGAHDQSPSEELSDLFARLFRPKAALCDAFFEVGIDNTHYVSCPTSVSESDRVPALWVADVPPAELDDTVTLEEWTKRAAARALVTNRHEVSLFNVVLAVDVPPGSDIRAAAAFGRPQVDDVLLLRDAVSQLSKCLLHEQRRARYVSQQVQILQDQKETHAASSNYVDTLTAQLESSRLARELVSLFTSLRDHRNAHLQINRLIRLSVGLTNPLKDGMLHVRPFHALLLTDSPAAVHACLPHDASPQLRRLIDAATPIKSFATLQVETGIELEHILRLAAHLRFWSKARIICALQEGTSLRVHHEADLRVGAANKHAARFHDVFSDLSYHSLLALISAGNALGRCVSSYSAALQQSVMDAIVWLLREKVIEQLHTYIHLVLPASFPALTHKSESPVAESDDGEAQLTAAELRSLEFERAGRDADAFVLLVRLAKYFRGVLPVQEILWRESESELALELVLREFSPILVRSERPAVS